MWKHVAGYRVDLITELLRNDKVLVVGIGVRGRSAEVKHYCNIGLIRHDIAKQLCGFVHLHRRGKGVLCLRPKPVCVGHFIYAAFVFDHERTRLRQEKFVRIPGQKR